MTDAHPSFPNPSLVEMLCEIHFAPQADREWDPKRPLGLYNSVSQDFPDMELVPEIDTQEFPGEVHRTGSQRSTSRIRFANNNKTRFLQVASAGDVFVTNFIDDYPGWPSAREEIVRYWDSFGRVLVPGDIWRIALRYINKVNHTKDAPLVSDWLRSTKSVPESMMFSLPGSYNISNIRLDEGHKSRVIVRFSDVSDRQPYGATIVDINRIWESQGKTEALSIVAILDTLHDDIWGEFSLALNEKYISYLNTKK